VDRDDRAEDPPTSVTYAINPCDTFRVSKGTVGCRTEDITVHRITLETYTAMDIRMGAVPFLVDGRLNPAVASAPGVNAHRRNIRCDKMLCATS
jgi:hypothetical protein